MVKLPDPYHDFVRELFEPLGVVEIKRMFGGAGVYSAGVMFALIADEELYLKVDEVLKAELKDEGSGPFVFQMKDGKSGEMNYWRMPTAAMDDSEEACDWARRAISVALAAAKAKPKRKRKGR